MDAPMSFGFFQNLARSHTCHAKEILDILVSHTALRSSKRPNKANGLVDGTCVVRKDRPERISKSIRKSPCGLASGSRSDGALKKAFGLGGAKEHVKRRGVVLCRFRKLGPGYGWRPTQQIDRDCRARVVSQPLRQSCMDAYHRGLRVPAYQRHPYPCVAGMKAWRSVPESDLPDVHQIDPGTFALGEIETTEGISQSAVSCSGRCGEEVVDLDIERQAG